MTEEEAKTKWCPYARVANPDVGVGYNRWVDGTGESIASNSRCLGSACMAWRWHYPEDWSEEMWTPNGLGYCGRAGKP